MIRSWGIAHARLNGLMQAPVVFLVQSNEPERLQSTGDGLQHFRSTENRSL